MVAAAGSTGIGVGLSEWGQGWCPRASSWRRLSFKVRRIAFFLISGSESNVRQWIGSFREPRRLALVWGLGAARGGAPLAVSCIRLLV